MSFFSKKWKLHLYINGVYVGKTTIKPGEKPSENVYVIKAYFKKQVFGNNFVQIVAHPTKFLYADEKKRQLHYSFNIEEGVED